MATNSSAVGDLRPLTLAELLDRAFTLYRNHFWLFAGITAIAQGLVFILMLPFGFWVGVKSASMSPAKVALAGAIGALLRLVAYFASEVATIYAVSEIYLGRSVTIRQAYSRARGKIGRIVWLAFLTGLAVMGGIILLVFPGIYIMCRTWVAVPAALLEDLPARSALNRSFALTKGDAGRIFIVIVLLILVGFAAASILQYPFQIAAGIIKEGPIAQALTMLATLGAMMAQILVGPIGLITVALFYYDLRVRKEAFDLQMMLTRLPGLAAAPAVSAPPAIS